MNDTNAGKKPTDQSLAASERSAAKPVQPRMKRMQVFTQRLLTIAYPFFTLLGFIYAHRYYHQFGIDFLSHATPLDFVLVAFANANKIVIVLLVTLVAVVLMVIASVAILLAAWAIALAVAFVITVLRFGQVLRQAFVVACRYVLAVGAAIVSPFVALARLLAIAYSKSRGREAAGSWWPEGPEDDPKDGTVAKYWRRLVYLWSPAHLWAKQACQKLSEESSTFKEKAARRFAKAKSVLTRGIAFLRRNMIVAFLALFATTSVFLAFRAGQLDSECVSENVADCTFGPGIVEYASDLGHYGVHSFSFATVEGQGRKSGEAVIVSTSNVAALEYLPRQHEGAGRKHVRVTIRQDAGVGRGEFPKCFTDVGATESAQFLFDFDDDRERLAARSDCQTVPEKKSPPGPVVVVFSGRGEGEEETTDTPGTEPPRPPPSSQLTVVVVEEDVAEPGGVTIRWLPSCDMTLAAWVGPFAVGKNDVGDTEYENGSNSCFSDRAGRGIRGFRVQEGLSDLRKSLKEREVNESKEIRRLIFLGRADREPIDNERYPSNFALAQARANWVREQLQELENDQSDTVHVLSIPGGPATTEIDMCDRVVEIHMCLAPAGSPDGGTKGEAADSQNRSEVGDEGEKGA